MELKLILLPITSDPESLMRLQVLMPPENPKYPKHWIVADAYFTPFVRRSVFQMFTVSLGSLHRER